MLELGFRRLFMVKKCLRPLCRPYGASNYTNNFNSSFKTKQLIFTIAEKNKKSLQFSSVILYYYACRKRELPTICKNTKSRCKRMLIFTVLY